MSSSDTFAERLAIAMELKGIKTVSSLARRTGIDRSYLYRMANGDIRNPHKYIDALASATDVSSSWLYTGKGSPYEDELQPSIPQGTLIRTVTIIPPEGGCYDVEARIPDLFGSPWHKAWKPELYHFYYVPEMIDCFPGFTLLMVEKEPQPGPGLYIAWRNENDKERLCSFHCSFKGMEIVSTHEPDMVVIGRVRNMDYWEMEISANPADVL